MGSFISEAPPPYLVERAFIDRLHSRFPRPFRYGSYRRASEWVSGFAWLVLFPLFGRSWPAQRFQLVLWYIRRLSPSRLHPFRAADTGPVAGHSSERFGAPVSFHEPSPVLTAMPAATFFGSSTLRLWKNGDGSISVLSDGRSVSLLRGRDPALVNPAVLPFLFPSCDSPVSPSKVQ